ncbi:MAG: hypothetical protein P8L66_08555 [Rhodospirillaceae bacterium]|nr:hypothetical protein [Rhodospirillaceae bacterium]
MPRKPNYQFERHERDRQKAAKKADRLAAKQARAAEKRGEQASDDATIDDSATADSDGTPSE